MFLFFYLLIAFVLLFFYPGFSILMVVGGGFLYGVYVVFKLLFEKPLRPRGTQSLSTQPADPIPALPITVDHSKETVAEYESAYVMKEEQRQDELLQHQAKQHQIRENESLHVEEDQRSWQDRLEDGYRP